MDSITELEIDVLHCLRRSTAGYTNALAEMHCEAASVCFDVVGQRSPIPVDVPRLEVSAKLLMRAPTLREKNAYADEQEATEWGATGIAVAVLTRCKNVEVIKRAAKGTGFDYYVNEASPDESDDPFSSDSKKLEISGILRKASGALVARRKQKVEQVLRTPELRGYVVIVEFENRRVDVTTV